MQALSELKTKLADNDALQAAIAMMDWDQQTYMPRGSAEARAQHVSILSRMEHESATSDEVGRLLERAATEVAPDSEDAALLRVAKRDFDLKTKIPAALVERKAKLASIAHEKWVEARKTSNFPGFAATLAEMFEIANEEAAHLGYKEHVYDALLDQYEEGATAADCRAMFETIKAPTVELVRKIQECGRQPDTSHLHGEWEIAKQKEFTEKLVEAIGFDMNRGRQDVAPHPFCTGWSVNDVRLTTRYQEHLGASIFGSLHEAGHGMYEQNSPQAWDHTPLAGGVSLGFHESQSRLWENIVGRSKPFWQHFLPALQAHFPSLDFLNPDSFHWAINKVEPSFIRVEADEVTYNLHVLLRFELECDILTGKLAVRDLPEAWNAKMKAYLGLTPKNDALGCLQDVHWSMGSVGYFPTYSMGNLLSYQIWAALQKDVPNTDALMSEGKFAPIFGWLREKIYLQGKRYTPKDLVKRVTGKPIGAEDWVAGITRKYSALYGV